jgi:hypothetical protein
MTARIKVDLIHLRKRIDVRGNHDCRQTPIPQLVAKGQMKENPNDYKDPSKRSAIHSFDCRRPVSEEEETHKERALEPKYGEGHLLFVIVILGIEGKKRKQGLLFFNSLFAASLIGHLRSSLSNYALSRP